MKRERSGESADGAPTQPSDAVAAPVKANGKWSATVVVNPDIPLSISSIPSVRALVLANNTAKKARHRLRVGEFLNVAFHTIGKNLKPDDDDIHRTLDRSQSCSGSSMHQERAAGVCDAAAASSSGDEPVGPRPGYTRTVHDLMTLLEEFIEQHHTLPRSTSLCAVLHVWHEHGLVTEGVALLQRVLRARTQVAPHSFRAAVGERVVTLALRLYAHSSQVTRSDALQLVDLLPSEALKRRVFAPLLQYAANKQDVCLVFDVLHRSQACQIELWDSDYYVILTLLREIQARVQGNVDEDSHHPSTAGDGVQSASDIRARTQEVLEVMSQHHPVVGADNARLIRFLLDGVFTEVNDAGRCEHCGAALQSFDLSATERAALLRDIVHKLVEPHMRQVLTANRGGGDASRTHPSARSGAAMVAVQSADRVGGGRSATDFPPSPSPAAEEGDKGSACEVVGTDAETHTWKDTSETTVPPRGGCGGRVSGSEAEERMWTEFHDFCRQMDALSYDVVIDGANVGYYGLSSWYREAKEVLLRRRGIDPARVTLRERTQVPLPVDVPPRFSLIESMRLAARRQGRQPLIILHARHLREVSEENEPHLRTWRQERAIVASPPFLNDDYCWLYAAVARVGVYVLTNDQMRDHHFGLLSPRSFLRWRQRHRLTYKVMYNKTVDTAALALHVPRSYSVWVQRAVAACAAAHHRRINSPPFASSPPARVCPGDGNEKAKQLTEEGVSTSAEPSHWHVPYLASVPVLQQATNHTDVSQEDVGLSKDGDDDCSGWVCTYSTYGKQIQPDKATPMT